MSAFRMTIEDIFAIKGRGTVVTGRVESGTLRVGDAVKVETAGAPIETVATSIEMFRRPVEEAHAGDTVGVFLRDVAKGDVQRGDVLMGAGASLSW